MNENVRHVVKTELTVLEMALRRNINDIERLEDQLDGARIYIHVLPIYIYGKYIEDF